MNQEIKQRILNGEFAKTRSGKRAKYIYTSENKDVLKPHLFIIYDKGEEKLFYLSSDFTEYESLKGWFDIVGLWDSDLY